MKNLCRYLLPGILALVSGCSRDIENPRDAKPLRIAAAADLKFALDEAIREYQAIHPEPSIEAVYGSSGNFFSQIRNGAPFDLYLSADIAYPQRLVEEGLSIGGVFPYAVGRIAIWAPHGFAGDVEALGIAAFDHPSVRKIAVANPEHAPYGRAALAALRSLGVFEKVESRLVYGENIAQTAQFVQSGAADLGIVALSLALADTMRTAGKFWEIPLESYPRMDQGGLILRRSTQVAGAEAFRDYLLGEDGRKLLARYGFFLPGNE